jgi:hypothetical protein
VNAQIKKASFSALMLCAMAVATSRSEAATCESLSSLLLPEVVSISANAFAGGTFQPPNPATFVPTPGRPFANPPISGLPSFCEVSILVAPQIRIEVWLPLASAWNHRFEGVGGGGYAGDISWSALAVALEAGFATASTDTGHSGNGGDGSFALNLANDMLNWGLIRDFAQRSEHELALKGKASLHAFYNDSPRFSYWTGCSTGGRQGWIEAQHHPEDYDGILAGAPAMNWDRFIPAELWPEIVMNEELGSPIATAKLDFATNAAVAACVGKDGGLASDAFLSDPRKCTFDPVANAQALGLTTPEASSLRKIWDGPRDSDGQRLWFGPTKGAALAGLAGQLPFPITVSHFVYWIHQDPTFDWHTISESSFVSDFFKSEKLFEDVIGTDSTDLERLIRHHTKVLGYHGWADRLIPPGGSVNYFERLFKRYGQEEVGTFARLFMVPGMDHCAAGPGPNSFGNFLPVPADAQHNAFIALQKWVEDGVAPEELIATKYLNDNPAGGVAFTRPLCVFPKVARYSGSGNSNDAANWSCAEDSRTSVVQQADEVLPDFGRQEDAGGDD